MDAVYYMVNHSGQLDGEKGVWEFETSVSGDRAAAFKVVRLDSLADAIDGDLISADSLAGTVSFKDRSGTVQNKNFGPHAIRIVPRR